MNKIFSMPSVIILIVIVIISLSGLYIFDKSRGIRKATIKIEKPSEKLEHEIYKKMLVMDFIKINQDVLEDLGLDTNKSLKSQRNKITGENWDYFFDNMAKDYKKTVLKLCNQSDKDKEFKYRKNIYFDDLLKKDKDKTDQEKINEQNKLLKKLYNVNYKNVNYVYLMVDKAKQYVNYKVEKYNPNKAEIEKYIKENETELSYYKYHSFMVKNEEEAKEFIKDLKKNMNFFSQANNRLDKDSKELIKYYKKEDPTLIEAPLYKVSNVSTRKWLADKSRKKGDIGYVADINQCSYEVLMYENKFLDRSNSYDIDLIIFNKESDANSALNNIQKAKDTELEFKKEANKIGIKSYNNAKLFKTNTPDDVIFYWVSDEKRKAGDLGKLDTDIGYAVIKFNHKNSDSRVIEEAKKAMKDEYKSSFYK